MSFLKISMKRQSKVALRNTCVQHTVLIIYTQPKSTLIMKCVINQTYFIPFRWYHGNISRQESYERLQNMAEPGAYLVRDSTNQPGDYAIAYLSKHRQIHHFKINSVCGDYYIGGRQFSSLVDLIGYYTNCSCILENERLEVPVMPPMVCYFISAVRN